MIISIFSPYYTTFKSKNYYDKIQNQRTFSVINWNESNENVILSVYDILGAFKVLLWRFSYSMHLSKR